MSWIKVIDYESADAKLKKIYDRVKGPNDNVDNVLKIHSLRPHTLVGHMTLYKNVLHNSNNTLPKWYLEALGVYVSYLNKCSYCFDHHFAGFSRLIKDEKQTEKFRKSILENNLSDFFEAKQLEGFRYAEKLTRSMSEICENDVSKLRELGFTDGEILEINQVVSYFNYVNRSVIGLGVTVTGDVLGLSPNNGDDPLNWQHD